MFDIEAIATATTGNPFLDLLSTELRKEGPLTLAFQAGQIGGRAARDGFLSDEQAVEWLEAHGVAIPSNAAAAEMVLVDLMSPGFDPHVVLGASVAFGVRNFFWRKAEYEASPEYEAAETERFARINGEQEEDTQPTAWN